MFVARRDLSLISSVGAECNGHSAPTELSWRRAMTAINISPLTGLRSVALKLRGRLIITVPRIALPDRGKRGAEWERGSRTPLGVLMGVFSHKRARFVNPDLLLMDAC